MNYINKVKRVLINFFVTVTLKAGLKKRYSRSQINILNNLDVLVVSPGGVGTTALIDHCKNYLTINDRDNLDGLKHKIKPFKNFKKELKVIYIDGDSLDIYYSLKRRDYFQTQLLNFESLLGVISSRLVGVKKFEKLLKLHKQNWCNMTHENILFLNYENLFESSKKINSFLNIQESHFVETFPKRKKRIKS